ncbi:unnamed protein product [Closterium sp. Yama58-4]|nr:unnamed protein product [Closterium sp. Yama58-4]
MASSTPSTANEGAASSSGITFKEMLEHPLYKHFQEIKKMYEDKGKAKADKGKAAAGAMEAIGGGPTGKRKISDFFSGETAEAKSRADEAISFFFAGLRIPEHHADHPLFRNMLRAVAEAGSGYVPPGRKYVGGSCLQKCRIRIEEGLAPIKKTWAKQGVTIASDMMTDRLSRAHANILLINDAGAMFTQSIDCGMETKTGTFIADMLRPIITEVGLQNVVALCTDGGSNYGSARWILGAEGNEMINFLRNHHWTRAALRDPTLPGGKVLQALRPAGTRFGTQYIAVSRLCKLEQKLTMLVTSDLWKGWAVGDRKEGAEKFASQVIDPTWWKTAGFFVKLLELFYKTMRMTDSTAHGMMGRMYDLMLQLTEDVEKVLDGDEKHLTRTDKARISRIVKDRWDNSLACSLQVAGRILNPLNQDEEIFGVDVECTRVFKEFIARASDYYERYPAMSGVSGRDVDLEAAVTAYLESRGSCGMPKAREAREKVKEKKQTMEQWWLWHCTEWPELARLARRVLSQPVSASSCERNWSMWDLVHTARRNRLGSVKCRVLVYVAHNWNVVHNFHKVPAEGAGIVKGNIPDPPIPEGYIVQDEEEEEEADEAEQKVLEDEYEEYPKKA